MKELNLSQEQKDEIAAKIEWEGDIDAYLNWGLHDCLVGTVIEEKVALYRKAREAVLEEFTLAGIEIDE